MIVDEKWPVARLIPITSASGVEAQERNAASALLAVMANVTEFGRAILKPLGAHAGRIQTFVEVPFELDGKKIRPDGLITVTHGSKTWTALVETKVGSSALEPAQMNAYLDIAKEKGFQAVLSISNHYVTASSSYPIEVDKRKTRRVSLSHRSWIDILTEAVVQKEHRGVSDPDQAYILSELIRYLSDPRSGVVTFNNMGPGWSKVKEGARSRTLRKTDDAVADVAARWDDLIRYLCLHLTMELGRDVKPATARNEANPVVRLANLKESLAAEGKLYGALAVPELRAGHHLRAARPAPRRRRSRVGIHRADPAARGRRLRSASSGQAPPRGRPRPRA